MSVHCISISMKKFVDFVFAEREIKLWILYGLRRYEIYVHTWIISFLIIL